MAILVTDPWLEDRLKAEREASGADRYDEVWGGICMMTPMPNNEHQELVVRLASIFQAVVGWAGHGHVFPGVNLSDRGDDWERDYRVPDIAVFLAGSAAENCGTHWRGGADLLVEITSPGDRTREKIPFYGRLGVVELLLLDRESWTLEQYATRQGELQRIGRSGVGADAVLAGKTVSLTYQLVSGDPRPQIQVAHVQSDRRWLV